MASAPVKFGARGVMPPGFAVGTRVRTSLAGRAKGINTRHPVRCGRVTGASKDGTCLYVHWDGNVSTTMCAYLAAYLERLEDAAAFAPEDIVTFWHRNVGSRRSSRVWCRVIRVEPGGEVTVRLPPGWESPTRTLAASRLTKHAAYGEALR